MVNNGDEIAHFFDGTGIAHITEKSTEEGQVVCLDGVFQMTVEVGDSAVHTEGGQVLFWKMGRQRWPARS